MVSPFIVPLSQAASAESGGAASAESDFAPRHELEKAKAEEDQKKEKARAAAASAPADRVIKAVVKYIRALQRIDDFEQLGNDVFGSATDPR